MKKSSDLSRLMGYAGKHRFLSYASRVLAAASALVGLIPFLYIWQMIREALAVAPHFAQAQGITRNGWLAVLFSVIAIVLYIAGLMCSHLAAFRIATNIRVHTMRHIAQLPLGMTERFGSGRLRSIVNESSAATETYLAHRLPDRAAAIATPIGLIGLLLFFDWRLGVLSLIPVVIAFSLMSLMMGRRLKERMAEYQNSLEEMSNEAVEFVRGVSVVKTFGQTAFSFKRFKGAIDRYCELVIDYTKMLRLPMMGFTTAVNGVFAFLIAGGLYFTRSGVTNEFLLNLLFYIIITPVISVTLTRIIFQGNDAMVVADALRRIDTILALRPLEETAQPKAFADNSVELRDVSFSYDGKKDALSHISLNIQPGQTVAFVGPSGGGKTTLANLLCRFFDPYEGKVLVGGVDVREAPKERLMEQVSFVFQNSRLIKASVLDNVRMGRPDATKEQVLQALRQAQCMDILEKLPRGMDTVIGTDGVFLSGGEQQRIAIARTLLKDSPIIILDEATAFADPDNEARVQAAFTALSRGRTVIMIAHRLSTVINADRIFVLNDGRLVQSGTGKALSEEEGLFRSMWNEYQTSVNWRVEREAMR